MEEQEAEGEMMPTSDQKQAMRNLQVELELFKELGCYARGAQVRLRDQSQPSTPHPPRGSV